MRKIVYTGQYMLKRAGRKSPNSFTQMRHQMPRPDVVMASGLRPSAGWTLETWEAFAKGRPPKLQQDLLAAIEELREEEAELVKTYLK